MTMRNQWNRSRILWAVLLLLLASVLGAVAALAAPAEKKAGAKDKGDWKNLQLIYTTDIKGKVDPCG